MTRLGRDSRYTSIISLGRDGDRNALGDSTRDHGGRNNVRQRLQNALHHAGALAEGYANSSSIMKAQAPTLQKLIFWVQLVRIALVSLLIGISLPLIDRVNAADAERETAASQRAYGEWR